MAAYSFIDNVNDFFSTGYFTEDFQKKVFDKSGYSANGIKELCTRFSALRQQYNRYKQAVTSRYARKKDQELATYEFNSRILDCLGYYHASPIDSPDTVLSLPLGENGKMEERAVRTVCSRTDGSPQLYVMDIPTFVSASDDTNAETGFAELGLDRLVTHIFSQPEQESPRYILMLSGNMVFFMDADKWERGAYLRFDIERLLVETTQSSMHQYFALFYLLVSKDALASTADTPLMQQLEEDSYKNAYAVTQDLKRGVVSAVEELANEAIWYIKQDEKHKYHLQDETDDHFETMMRDDCLVYIYRLLFVFYAESRPDLDILPINDQTYQRGYSLEMLRDLEQVNLITEEERSGYFFDYSIKQLFTLILRGYNEDRVDKDSMTASFRVRHIDSPLFSDTKLHLLAGVKFRNAVWQRIICQLSLSQQQKGKMRGRISYANLGINQLGSVYENLLAYRGFYAEEDYIEVHPKGDTVETYLQPRSRRDVFAEDEILKDEEGNDIIHRKGKFIYRLNGRDRKKSASFYTPEVLTKSTVKYTLRSIVEKLERHEIEASELLQMKILEPAMGAAAFQNEVINQLAVLYLQFRKQEVGEAIDPLQYPNELQKVKAFIATNNVYGVDLNATALELGKLSLWLNVMHKDMETPFFSNRIAHGNAVIGAWLKVYKQSDVLRDANAQTHRATDKAWWEKPLRRISFTKTGTNRHYTEVYHFLLPVKDMLGVLSTKQRPRTDAAYKLMVEKRKGWIKGITSEEYTQLKRISGKIDALLKVYVIFQMSIAEYANNGYHVWKYAGNRTFPFNTNAERQKLDDRRYRKNSPYMKLKMVMDYWCALFFWEFENAADLPTRQEYWNDIERMLDVDTTDEAKVKFSSADKTGQEDLFLPKQGSFSFDEAEKESEIKIKALKDLLAEEGGRQTGVLQLEGVASSKRYSIVEQLANRYHFFHPMLEFLEVFWLRDGFDIICGNPPWLKYTFKDEDILTEKFPEVLLHKHKGEVMTKEEMFEASPELKKLYNSELVEITCSGVFMNSLCNYPMLVGQQTNLYKCVLENSLQLMSKNGYMGLVHPETIYDEPNGQSLRQYVYRHLRYHFRFRNSLLLFAEVRDQKQYSINVYCGKDKEPEFDCIFNLYHPSTIDECFASDGRGKCEGIKIETAKGLTWNLRGHKKRVIHFTEQSLMTLAKVFEDSEKWNSAKLASMYVVDVISVLEKLAFFKTAVKDFNPIITQGYDSTNAITDGTLDFLIQEPNVENYEMVYSGPNIYVGTAFYKSPRIGGYKKSDFDVIDLEKIDKAYCVRTRYVPKVSIDKLTHTFQSFSEEKSWQDYYKVGFRKMLNQTGDRTLNSGILIKKSSHVNAVISATFANDAHTVELAGLTSSLVLDFLMKAFGTANLTDSRLKEFPMGINKKYRNALFLRTLLLNCMTENYSDLWEEFFDSEFTTEQWSLNDNRLKSFEILTKAWSVDTPLRNDFERRQALLEIDVIVAQAMGLTLDELITIYQSQFDVLQKNESLTFYDKTGKIVYTKNAGLTGVGVDTADWENIKNQVDGDTYLHTISKNELYKGQTTTYYAPYLSYDREADYRRAWAYFEERFKNYDE